MFDFDAVRDDNRMPTGFPPPKMPVISRWGTDLSVNVKFETDIEMINKLLPPGLKAQSGEVTVYQNRYVNVNFLAGRGYNFFGISVPVIYEKNGRKLTGVYLPVCWMNDTFAIIFGREGAGYPKLFGEVHDPIQTETGYYCSVGEYGHRMIELEVFNLVHVPSENISKEIYESNLFLRKRICGFGDQAEIDYLTVGKTYSKTLEYALAKGTVKFNETTWEKAPLSYNVISYLREMPIIKFTGAFVTKGELWSYGGGIGREKLD